ncbi:hypothetical protein GH714_010950 [Hevea brasiliensis]|uniref:Uncharacterized protein n=1 Tax=Hevea brasiliensis TaxID=3981 RepID=A0A6A6NGF0_HEVBR|nr:hypothetical protein GH714_010950 [Hevea brasiliensis]
MVEVALPGSFQASRSCTAGTAIHSGGSPTVLAYWTRDVGWSESAPAVFSTNAAIATMAKSPGHSTPPSQAFAPSSFGQPQNNVSASSQFQPIRQMYAPVVPVGGQPWLASRSNGVLIATAVQPTGQQPSATSTSDPAIRLVHDPFNHPGRQ